MAREYVLEAYWQAHGQDCAVVQYAWERAGVEDLFEITFLGCGLQPFWRCGYVRLPEGHPWTQLGGYWNESFGPRMWIPNYPDADVHYGVTYLDERSPVPELEPGWWIGFDTHHHDDTMERWPLDAVKDETERLAKQVAVALQEIEKS